ncbi:1823_t:CDS:2, partial [Rhizophagus irregularis]
MTESSESSSSESSSAEAITIVNESDYTPCNALIKPEKKFSKSPKEVNNVPNLSVDHPNNASPLLCEEDRKTDEFLYSVQKKSVSDGIRRRKLQKQDLTSDDKRSLQKKNQREKFIQEVSGIPSDLSDFARLYEKLRNAEDFADRAVQEAIICYCQFGKALIQRRDTSDALLWKRIEQAKKLWKLFDAIDNMPVDYSIKIESSDCAWPKDGLLSDEKKSELSHPDLSSGSDKKNSELSHTNTSHIEQAPNASS